MFYQKVRCDSMSDNDDSVVGLLNSDLTSFIVDINEYEKIRLIGKGGYAEVWLASHKTTDQKVALKQLFPNLTAKQAQSFVREIRTMSFGDHPFFLKFIGFSPTRPFSLVSEYMINGSLFRFLRSEKRSQKLTGTHRTMIAMGVAHAMSHLHSLGIIHRDLKSMNILLDGNCLPRICDFGIARFLDGTEAVMTTNIGTPHWMAPEMLEGEAYNSAVDVYSFAMLLYEMASDQIPWAGVDPATVIKFVCNDKSRPVIPNSVPDSVRKLIQLCWSQSPSRRPTFSGIYHLFKTNQVAFEGTDVQMVRHLEKKLRRFDTRHKGNVSPEKQRRNTGEIIESPRKALRKRGLSCDTDYSRVCLDEANVVGSPLRADTFDEEINDIELSLMYRGESPWTEEPEFKSNLVDISVIEDSGNCEFRSELRKAANGLQEGQAREFFTALSVYFSDNTSTELFDLILSNLKCIVENFWAVDVFAELGLHKKLPIKSDRLFDASMEVLLRLFRTDPALFQDNYQDEMSYVITKSPKKAVVLLATFCQAFDRLDNAWGLLDLLIKKSQIFMKSDASREFVSTLFYLCSNYPKYNEARLHHCIEIFKQGIAHDDPDTVSACYNACCTFWSHSIEIDMERLVLHLRTPSIAESAVPVLLMIRHIPRTAPLVEALLECAEKFVEACFALIRVAVKEEGAVLILRDPSWISRKLPTESHTLRLFLTIFYHNAFRQKLLELSETAVMFVNMSKTRTVSAIATIAAIIKHGEVTPSIIANLSKGNAFTSIFQTAVEIGEESVMKSALEIVGVCAQIDFVDEYETIIDLIPEILEIGTKLDSTVVAVMAILSRYETSAVQMRKLGLEELFIARFSRDPNYRKYSTMFLNNMK